MIYDYVCVNCQHQFEKIVKMADRLVAIEAPCPECGEMTIEQYLTMPAVIDIHKTMNKKQPDGEFKERMQKIHQTTPGSTLDKSGYV